MWFLGASEIDGAESQRVEHSERFYDGPRAHATLGYKSSDEYERLRAFLGILFGLQAYK